MSENIENKNDVNEQMANELVQKCRNMTLEVLKVQLLGEFLDKINLAPIVVSDVDGNETTAIVGELDFDSAVKFISYKKFTKQDKEIVKKLLNDYGILKGYVFVNNSDTETDFRDDMCEGDDFSLETINDDIWNSVCSELGITLTDGELETLRNKYFDFMVTVEETLVGKWYFCQNAYSKCMDEIIRTTLSQLATY